MLTLVQNEHLHIFKKVYHKSFEMSSAREKIEKKTGLLSRFSKLWRRGRDSNPCGIAPKLISSQPRYDHFDTSPYCGGVRRCVTPEKREQETTPATPTAILTRKRAFCKPFFDFYFLFNCFFAANGCPECEKMLNRDSSFPPAGKEGMPRSHAAFGRRPRRAGRQGS